MSLLQEILSEKGNASSMRLCTIMTVGVILQNWVVGTIASLTVPGAVFTIDPAEIAALFGVLGIKWGQKKTELSKLS